MSRPARDPFLRQTNKLVRKLAADVRMRNRVMTTGRRSSGTVGSVLKSMGMKGFPSAPRGKAWGATPGAIYGRSSGWDESLHPRDNEGKFENK